MLQLLDNVGNNDEERQEYADVVIGYVMNMYRAGAKKEECDTVFFNNVEEARAAMMRYAKANLPTKRTIEKADEHLADPERITQLIKKNGRFVDNIHKLKCVIKPVISRQPIKNLNTGMIIPEYVMLHLKDVLDQMSALRSSGAGTSLVSNNIYRSLLIVKKYFASLGKDPIPNRSNNNGEEEIDPNTIWRYNPREDEERSRQEVREENRELRQAQRQADRIAQGRFPSPNPRAAARMRHS